MNRCYFYYRTLTSVWLGLSLMLLSGCAPSQSPTARAKPEIWRFAIEESVGSVQHAYALEFKRRIEQQTQGEVEVVVYPYGSLGTATQLTEQLNMGVLEFAMASPGSLGKFIPELQVFLLHFVLPASERDKQALFTHPELLSFFDALYAPKGLQLLSIFSEGEMVWTLKQQVRTPSDFSGLKMRVMTSPILLSAYAAYGASPTPMPYSEVYSGLQLNMIDGQVNPMFAIERQKFYEVADWFIFPHHTSFVTTCAANREFMQQLPTSRRTLVTQVFRELDEFVFLRQTQFQHARLRDIAREMQAKETRLHLVGELSLFREFLRSEGEMALLDQNPFLMVHPPLTTQERAAFEAASKQVVEDFLEVGGPEAQSAIRLIRDLAP